ncbi:MAG: type II toxin-antitoxin system VapC family toxin [Elainellaceae cyanobacterium]
MRQIVLDAGPLIGLFYAKDNLHQDCVTGFQQLAQQETLLLTPVPIIFEVYKWLLQRTSSDTAQTALKAMQISLYPLPLDKSSFGKLQVVVTGLPQWRGALEDGTVMLTALKYRCPIWTYNFRDFNVFRTLEFWNPNIKN